MLILIWLTMRMSSLLSAIAHGVAGQYYDCAGDIVRNWSLDFDSQRADVEIIFTFRHQIG